MPLLPAICDDCSSLFIPNAIRIENSTGINLRNVAVGPCPWCGGMGHIPDGIYDATAEGIKVVATSAKSAASLARLQRLLEVARLRQLSAEETADAIEREVPEYRPLADVARRVKGVPFLTWVALILAGVTIIQAEVADQRLDDVQSKVDKIYDQVVTQSAPPAPSPRAIATAPQRAVPVVGRNQPCPCGSGKKYKNCHGR